MERLADHLATECLAVLGTLAIGPGDALPLPQGTLLLIGPDEPAFWPHFKGSPEAGDGGPDPLDRWSIRILTAIAQPIGADVLFPFGSPPFHPFIAWARRSGTSHTSPVGLLVHAERGLFFSCRGALLVPDRLPPTAAPSPCLPCTQPCRTACPVGALTASGYDVDACKAWLDTAAGADCRTGGCLVRRACPVGAARRLPDQSAFHMAAFAPLSKAAPCPAP